MGEAIAHSTGNVWLGRAIGGGSVLIFGLFNYFGIIYGGRAMLSMTVLKLFPLFCARAWRLDEIQAFSS